MFVRRLAEIFSATQQQTVTLRGRWKKSKSHGPIHHAKNGSMESHHRTDGHAMPDVMARGRRVHAHGGRPVLAKLRNFQQK